MSWYEHFTSSWKGVSDAVWVILSALGTMIAGCSVGAILAMEKRDATRALIIAYSIFGGAIGMISMICAWLIFKQVPFVDLIKLLVSVGLLGPVSLIGIRYGAKFYLNKVKHMKIGLTVEIDNTEEKD